MNRFVFAALAFFWFVTGFAQEADALTGLRGCMTQNEDARRLACYDSEMKRLGQQAATKPATAAATAVAAAAPVAAASPEERFGYRGEVAREELDRQEATPELEELTASIAAVVTQPYGELVVTLDNGQVWAQKRPDSLVRLKVGDQVTIKSGSFGSFSLVGPRGRSTQVSRVR